MNAYAFFAFKNYNLEQVVSTLRFLRVLYLNGTLIEHLPNHDLWISIYVGLRDMRINDLPNY